LEDEFHFLFECPFYNELSKRFIKPCYWKILNIPKFIELMTTEKNEIRNISMYTMKAVEI